MKQYQHITDLRRPPKEWTQTHVVTYEDLWPEFHIWLSKISFLIGVYAETTGQVLELERYSGLIGINWNSHGGVLRLHLNAPEITTFDYETYRICGRDQRFFCYQKVEDKIRELLPRAETYKCFVCQERLWLEKDQAGTFFCRTHIQENYPKENNGKQGYVYLYGNEAERWYKIGHSINPVTRTKSFDKILLPFPCKLLHSFPATNARKAEGELHKRFSDNRTNGEWFRLSDKEKEYIFSLPTVTEA